MSKITKDGTNWGVDSWDTSILKREESINPSKIILAGAPSSIIAKKQKKSSNPLEWQIGKENGNRVERRGWYLRLRKEKSAVKAHFME